MALKTRCQTPEAMFTIAISRTAVSVRAELPFGIDLTESQAELLEANLHNAVELALAPLFACRPDHNPLGNCRTGGIDGTPVMADTR
jgi:hypothetical protein